MMDAVSIRPPAIGSPVNRIDGPEKVKGDATYASEWPVERPAYLAPLQAVIGAGRVTGIDAAAAAAQSGVLGVLTHLNAPRLVSAQDPELFILQSDQVAYRGQFIGGVIADTPEIARHAAGLVQVAYQPRAHDVELRSDREDLYTPDRIQGRFQPADSIQGDVEAALATAAVRIDAGYSTPTEHHNPMEPHATIATWANQALTLRVASQGVHLMRRAIASAFGLPLQQVRVISPHVGGGFGSKNYVHADMVLAAMAAQLVPGRPVKLALTRQQMFSQVGYRTPTIQRIRLGAEADGRLTAIAHDAVEQTAKFKEFAEQTAVCSRMMYAAPNRRTTHRLAALDVPVPTIMRAPGEAPGMFALESAMDEMATACGLDPVEFRIRNEPDVDPDSGLPFSSRHLVSCLREGARRFGWEARDPAPGIRRERGWLVGTGVAASTYPMYRLSGNTATIRLRPDGRYAVMIGAADIGTGTWTALSQIAADALGVALADVQLQIGDTTLPAASAAGGSSGINSWGSAIVEAAQRLRARVEADPTIPPEGLEVTADMPDNPYLDQVSMHAFGALFAEAHVGEETGEVRVPRLLGVFDAGRIINPKTARSQLLGGMVMGLSMALFEESVVDGRFGWHVVNHDFAEYHIATHADVGSIEVDWLDEEDRYFSPMGSKGIGELGIVGTAAAIANAVYHASGTRVRDLPITLDKLLGTRTRSGTA